MSTSKLPLALLEAKTWEVKGRPIWPATSFFIRRNLSSYLFGDNLQDKDRKAVNQTLLETLTKLNLLKNPLSFSSKELSATDKQFLMEHFVLSDDVISQEDEEFFLVDDSATFLAIVGGQDHLCLQIIDHSQNWREIYERIQKLNHLLNRACDFAYDEKFGYLTTELAHVGTGFSAEMYLHLPAMNYYAQYDVQALQEVEKHAILSGLDHSAQLLADFAVLQNRFSLGVSEEEVLREMYLMADKLREQEQLLRDTIRSNPSAEIKDKILRAHGLLTHSYELKTQEALNALSLLKLGCDLGYVKNMESFTLFNLLFQSRKGHLNLSLEESLAREQIPHKRAEVLQLRLKDLEIAF